MTWALRRIPQMLRLHPWRPFRRCSDAKMGSRARDAPSFGCKTKCPGSRSGHREMLLSIPVGVSLASGDVSSLSRCAGRYVPVPASRTGGKHPPNRRVDPRLRRRRRARRSRRTTSRGSGGSRQRRVTTARLARPSSPNQVTTNTRLARIPRRRPRVRRRRSLANACNRVRSGTPATWRPPGCTRCDHSRVHTTSRRLRRCNSTR